MSIQIQSTSDTPEQIRAALGQAEPQKDQSGSSEAAPDEATDETAAASETAGDEADPQEDGEVSEDEDQADGVSGGDEDAQASKKRLSGTKRRIQSLARARDAAAQEAAYWREQALKGQGKEGPDPAPQKAAETDPTKPRPDQFETHEAYVEALTDWKVEKHAQKFQAEQAKRQQTEQQTKIAQAYEQRAETFRKVAKDYDDVLASTSDIAIPMHLLNAIQTSDFGPQIAYELAKNANELERIAALDPASALRAIGRLEAKLEKPEPKKAVKKSSAPPPIRPVGGGRSASSARAGIFDPNISQAEYERLRKEQMKSRRA